MDVNESVIAIAGVGTIGVPWLISQLVYVLKDYLPNLAGRWAIAAVDLVSVVAAAMLLYGVQPEDGWTLAGVLMALVPTWMACRIIARGMYALDQQRTRQ